MSIKKNIKHLLSTITKPIYHISYGAAVDAQNGNLQIASLKTEINELKQLTKTLLDEKNHTAEINDLEFNAKYLYYYHGGAGNHGCEALVRTITSLCAIPRHNLGLYSYRPEQDREFGLLNLASFIKKSNLDASEIPQFFSSDTVAVSIGGDNYCGYPIPQLAHYNRTFHNNGAKTALVGCSIEPDNLSHGEIVGDLCQFDLITARESITYDALAAKGITKNLHLIPDSAFLLPTEPSGITLSPNTVGINISSMVTIDKDNLVLENSLELIRYILEKTNYNIALIPHVHQDFNDDVKILKILYNHFSKNPRIQLIDSNFNACQIKDIVRQCTMLVAARTHCSIAGYSSHVPTLVLGYSVKSKGIARDIFGTEENYVKSIHSLQNKEEVKNAFIWLDQHKEAIRQHLSSFMPTYSKKASRVKKYLTALSTMPNKSKPLNTPKKAKIGHYHKGQLSIITSCYNSQEYLYRYLDSILSQTNHNIQLIIVNDGSNDRTEQIIFDYIPVLEKQGIEVVYLKQSNGGISAAYNTALQYLSGEFFCWCDSDNFYAPNFVEKVLHFFSNHPEANILRHDGYLIPEQQYDETTIFSNQQDFRKFSSNSPHPNTKKLFMNSILEKNWHFGNIILRTSAFDQVSKRHIFPSRDGQNWQLCLPMLYAYDAYYIPDILFYFIVRQNSVSHQNIETNDNTLLFQQLDEYQKILIETISQMDVPDKDNLLKIIEQKYICLKLQFAKDTNDTTNVQHYTKLFKQIVEPDNLYQKALNSIK